MGPAEFVGLSPSTWRLNPVRRCDRVTDCLACLELCNMRGFLECGTFSGSTGTVLGKLGQLGALILIPVLISALVQTVLDKLISAFAG